MKTAGLTGGLACGKSVVAKLFRDLGAATLDTDQVSRQVVAPGTPGLAALADRFGAGILTADGRLDRDRLGKIVFGDTPARLALEAVVHPLVYRAVGEWLAEQVAGKTAVAILEIPLLFEVEVPFHFDAIICVRASRPTQVARVKARSGYDDATIDGILTAQMAVEEKAARADFVIDNEGDLTETRRQVEDVYQRLLT